MKFLLTPAALILMAASTFAQTDTTTQNKPDTIKVGGIIIINRNDSTVVSDGEKGKDGKDGHHNFTININKNRKPKNRLVTSFLHIDFGASNYNDQTDYTSASAREYARAIRPGEADYTSSDLRLMTKSINFNLWLVKQRYGITRDSKLQARWGLMLETNNYRYDVPNSYNNASRPFMFRDSVTFSKNKLAMDYLTVPLMLGFNSKPNQDNGFAISAGVSIGYLYSSRNKQVSSERGKEKNRGNFDVEPFKFQYVAEVGIGAVRLYGAYSPQSIYKRGLDIRPFNVGLRLGEWW